MGSYPNDRSNNPLGPITYGRDFNFFQEVTPGSSGAATFAFDCDAVITFPSYTVTFWLPATGGSAGQLQYSFNGNTVHGTLDSTGLTAPATLTFQNRQLCKIWFTTTGGSPVVRVEAWGTR
jgi:hypothetical protein